LAERSLSEKRIIEDSEKQKGNTSLVSNLFTSRLFPSESSKPSGHRGDVVGIARGRCWEIWRLGKAVCPGWRGT